jgi:hypothetical protein
MGDPSVEVSHIAFQEVEGVVMKTILVVSLSTSSDQAIFCFLIYMYFCLLLVRESGTSC